MKKYYKNLDSTYLYLERLIYGDFFKILKYRLVNGELKPVINGQTFWWALEQTIGSFAMRFSAYETWRVKLFNELGLISFIILEVFLINFYKCQCFDIFLKKLKPLFSCLTNWDPMRRLFDFLANFFLNIDEKG